MTNANDVVYPSAHTAQHGLTKRELFAAMALQGLLANPHLLGIALESELYPNDAAKSYAETAVTHADALIKQLNESK